jgi:hypothetical protein
MTTHENALVLQMTAEYGSRFASLALAHVKREYPNKLDHVLLGADDVRDPRALHPIFFGSLDWHSCVHGYWLLARVYRRYPNIAEAGRIRALFHAQLTVQNVETEVRYAAHPSRSGFERPYGWAWLLMLSAELLRHDSDEGRHWAQALASLAAVFVSRFHEFLPKATYPVRAGTHFNTAFAVILGMEYARVANDSALAQALGDAAIRWYRGDANAIAWEPSGDDFLSSTLVEAECMRRVLPPHEFASWFNDFLPDIKRRTPGTLFVPATVSDRSDGKIAHLDGLNFSRAWCWRLLAASLPANDARRLIAREAADAHLNASLPHVAGDYMGEHWLATYALLALESAGGDIG